MYNFLYTYKNKIVFRKIVFHTLQMYNNKYEKLQYNNRVVSNKIKTTVFHSFLKFSESSIP